MEIVDADATDMKTAVVILNWNTEDFLRKYLPGLINSVSSIDGAEVIVADNDSSDSSLELMKTLFPSVRTIELEKNFGFTGGYNKAFEQIDCEYFVLINSDIEVPENWLQPLIEWMDNHPDCGACAPKLHSWYHVLQSYTAIRIRTSLNMPELQEAISTNSATRSAADAY